jgi:hypothetical protein
MGANLSPSVPSMPFSPLDALQSPRCPVLSGVSHPGTLYEVRRGAYLTPWHPVRGAQRGLSHLPRFAALSLIRVRSRPVSLTSSEDGIPLQYSCWLVRVSR